MNGAADRSNNGARSNAGLKELENAAQGLNPKALRYGKDENSRKKHKKEEGRKYGSSEYGTGIAAKERKDRKEIGQNFTRDGATSVTVFFCVLCALLRLFLFRASLDFRFLLFAPFCGYSGLIHEKTPN